MVAKVVKRTPTKSLKTFIRRKKSKSKSKSSSSPSKSKSNPSVVISALHDSFFTCRRRLAKIFSKLARISTPTKHRKIKPHGGEEDSEIQSLISPSAKKPLFFGLPPPLHPHTQTIFLDLDETLIHSTPDPPPEKYDFVVTPVIDGQAMNFYVLKRPGVEQLLESLSKGFEIAVFTAGIREYASLVLDQLDRNGVISHRLYRDSCRELEGRFVKDLSQMGRDLRKVVIVDDNPNSYVFQPENAIQVRPFVDDLEDVEVWRLIDFFDRGCQGFDDLREAIKVFAPLGWQNLHC